MPRGRVRQGPAPPWPMSTASLLNAISGMKDESSARDVVLEMLRGPIEPVVLEEKDDVGFTPLFWSVYHGDDEVMKRLLEAGANMYAKDKHGSTVLGTAAWYGHSKCVKGLLEKCDTGHAKEANEAGMTALGGAKVARELSAEKADHGKCIELLNN